MRYGKKYTERKRKRRQNERKKGRKTKVIYRKRILKRNGEKEAAWRRKKNSRERREL